jgi:hypothetical protein
MMNKVKFAVVCLLVLFTGCSSVVGDANLGPNPGGGFYTGPNINVGHINPSSYYQGQTLAQRPL